MKDQPNQEDALFDAALQLPSAEGRTAYLNEACKGDDQLRQRVEALLKAHEQAGGFLEQPPASATTFVITTGMMPVTEKAGDKIGRYKLLQQIGEGGCGVVYVAEQTGMKSLRRSSVERLCLSQ